jgi:hypothetical protein
VSGASRRARLRALERIYGDWAPELKIILVRGEAEAPRAAEPEPGVRLTIAIRKGASS